MLPAGRNSRVVPPTDLCEDLTSARPPAGRSYLAVPSADDGGDPPFAEPRADGSCLATLFADSGSRYTYRSRELAEQGGGEELVAVEIRLALDGIGKITGTIYTDDILDVVFRQFCIGK